MSIFLHTVEKNSVRAHVYDRHTCYRRWFKIFRRFLVSVDNVWRRLFNGNIAVLVLGNTVNYFICNRYIDSLGRDDFSITGNRSTVRSRH